MQGRLHGVLLPSLLEIMAMAESKTKMFTVGRGIETGKERSSRCS